MLIVVPATGCSRSVPDLLFFSLRLGRWWLAQPFDLCTEATAMIALGIISSLAGSLFLCWLLFSLARFALPLFAGMTVGLWAFDQGTGLVPALLLGSATGGITLAAGQWLVATVRPSWLQITIALMFAVPAAIAGYSTVHGLSALMVPSAGWQLACSIMGAVITGSGAWMQMAGQGAS